MKEHKEPESLQEAVIYFADPDNCIHYLFVRRWPDGKVICPTCGSDSVSEFNSSRRTWQCASHHAKREFSIKVGTIFDESPIGLDKWLTAMWMLTNCKNGVSSCEIARAVKVTQKAAWFMVHRIRLALQDEFFGSKMGGEVEVDETFIGGKARNMHLSERERRITGTGGKDKTIVFGESWNVAEKFGLPWYRNAEESRTSILQFANTSKLERLSTLTRLHLL